MWLEGIGRQTDAETSKGPPAELLRRLCSIEVRHAALLLDEWDHLFEETSPFMHKAEVEQRISGNLSLAPGLAARSHSDGIGEFTCRSKNCSSVGIAVVVSPKSLLITPRFVAFRSNPLMTWKTRVQRLSSSGTWFGQRCALSKKCVVFL